MKILIMGLPGSGKTVLAQELTSRLESSRKTVTWLNADKIREIFNDWDFSYEGRIRQAIRMKRLSNGSEDNYVIADFVAPLEEMRTIFNADLTIWVDTIKAGQYEDTNKLFEPPKQCDIHVTSQDANYWCELIHQYITETEDT